MKYCFSTITEMKNLTPGRNTSMTARETSSPPAGTKPMAHSLIGVKPRMMTMATLFPIFGPTLPKRRTVTTPTFTKTSTMKRGILSAGPAIPMKYCIALPNTRCWRFPPRQAATLIWFFPLREPQSPERTHPPLRLKAASPAGAEVSPVPSTALPV